MSRIATITSRADVVFQDLGRSAYAFHLPLCPFLRNETAFSTVPLDRSIQKGLSIHENPKPPPTTDRLIPFFGVGKGSIDRKSNVATDPSTTRHTHVLDVQARKRGNDMAHLPDVYWAQRTDKILMTIDVPDCPQPKVEIGNHDGGDGYLKFQGTNGSNGVDYEVQIDLYGKVNAEGSKISAGGRNVFLAIQKETEGPHWPRLAKEKTKLRNVHCDWNKWKDEDEEEEEGACAIRSDRREKFDVPWSLESPTRFVELHDEKLHTRTKARPDASTGIGARGRRIDRDLSLSCVPTFSSSILRVPKHRNPSIGRRRFEKFLTVCLGNAPGSDIYHRRQLRFGRIGQFCGTC